MTIPDINPLFVTLKKEEEYEYFKSTICLMRIYYLSENLVNIMMERTIFALSEGNIKYV